MKRCRVVPLRLQQLGQAGELLGSIDVSSRSIRRNIKGSVHDKFRIRGIALTDLLVKTRKVKVTCRQLVHIRCNLLPVDGQINQEILKRLHLNDNQILSLGGTE
ncbi:hypothetical protein D3C75_1021180 [compost metagenome]